MYKNELNFEHFFPSLRWSPSFIFEFISNCSMNFTYYGIFIAAGRMSFVARKGDLFLATAFAVA